MKDYEASTLHNYSKLRNAESSRKPSPIIGILYQMVSPEIRYKIHASNTIQTEQVAFGNLGTHTILKKKNLNGKRGAAHGRDWRIG